jgi:hypothetical protein
MSTQPPDLPPLDASKPDDVRLQHPVKPVSTEPSLPAPTSSAAPPPAKPTKKAPSLPPNGKASDSKLFQQDSK